MILVKSIVLQGKVWSLRTLNDFGKNVWREHLEEIRYICTYAENIQDRQLENTSGAMSRIYIRDPGANPIREHAINIAGTSGSAS